MRFARCSKVLWTVALLVLVVATQAAITQKVANTGPKYDIANEVKIKGVVEDIREVPGEFEGTQLVVKTDTGTVLVHVAPADFLKEMAVSFVKGDRILIVGAKVKFGDGLVVLVREVWKQNSTLYLRDQNGTPYWPSSEKGRT